MFPFLAKMEFDTKEPTKFFGQAREHACAIGSGPRKGRSAFRSCTPHASRHDVNRKFLVIDGVTPATEQDVQAAEDSLRRRGIHPHNRCTALKNLVHCVISWPGRMYYGLVGFDVMHIVYLNWIKYLPAGNFVVDADSYSTKPVEPTSPQFFTVPQSSRRDN